MVKQFLIDKICLHKSIAYLSPTANKLWQKSDIFDYYQFRQAVFLPQNSAFLYCIHSNFVKTTVTVRVGIGKICIKQKIQRGTDSSKGDRKGRPYRIAWPHVYRAGFHLYIKRYLGIPQSPRKGQAPPLTYPGFMIARHALSIFFFFFADLPVNIYGR